MTASWSPAERAAFEARRKSRNFALGLILGALVLLFFGITVVRMGSSLAGDAPVAGEARNAATRQGIPVP